MWQQKNPECVAPQTRTICHIKEQARAEAKLEAMREKAARARLVCGGVECPAVLPANEGSAEAQLRQEAEMNRAALKIQAAWRRGNSTSFRAGPQGKTVTR